MVEPSIDVSRPIQQRYQHRPRCSDKDYEQFKARVTKVVNQQQTVSPSSFSAKGRQYVQRRKKKLALTLAAKREQDNDPPGMSGSRVVDAEKDLFSDEKSKTSSSIPEPSESSSASQSEWRSVLKDQVMTNVKKFHQTRVSRTDASYAELLPDDLAKSNNRHRQDRSDAEFTRQYNSGDSSFFQKFDSGRDFHLSPFPAPSRARLGRSLSPVRKQKTSSSKRASSVVPTSPTSACSTRTSRSPTSTRTPRSASSTRKGSNSVKSPKSTCSTRTGASRSAFSGTTGSGSRASTGTSRSRSSSPSKSQSKSLNISRSLSPARTSFKVPLVASPTRRQYKHLSPGSDTSSPTENRVKTVKESNYLMVPTLHEDNFGLGHENPQSEEMECETRGSPMIFRDFFTGEREMVVSGRSPAQSKPIIFTKEVTADASVPCSPESKTISVESIEPLHIIPSQPEESFFEEVQRPVPDLQLYLPRTCTLSATDEEDDDADVLSKVTITTTRGIHVKRENDDSPTNMRIVEQILAQLVREEERQDLEGGEDVETSSPRSRRRSKRSRPKRLEKTLISNGYQSEGEAEEDVQDTDLARYDYDEQDDLELEHRVMAHVQPHGLHSPPPIHRLRARGACNEDEMEVASVYGDEQEQVEEVPNTSNAETFQHDIQDTLDQEYYESPTPAGQSYLSSRTRYQPNATPVDSAYNINSSLGLAPPILNPDSFEHHPLVALSTTDSSAVPQLSPVQYFQPEPSGPYDMFYPPSVDQESSLVNDDSQSRTRRAKWRHNFQKGNASERRGKPPQKSNRNKHGGGHMDESYESFDTYETGKGLLSSLCDPVASVVFCKCMGEIPPPTRQMRSQNQDNDTCDGSSFINTTHGRPLPILSTSNLSIEDDDMFDVVEKCFCG